MSDQENATEDRPKAKNPLLNTVIEEMLAVVLKHDANKGEIATITSVRIVNECATVVHGSSKQLAGCIEGIACHEATPEIMANEVMGMIANILGEIAEDEKKSTSGEPAPEKKEEAKPTA